MRMAVALARLAGNGSKATSPLASCSTLGSAAALNLDDEIGSLEPDKRADLAVGQASTDRRIYRGRIRRAPS